MSKLLTFLKFTINQNNSINWTLVWSIIFFISFVSQLNCVNSQANAECHFPRLTPRHGLNLTKLMGKWFLHEFAVSDRNFDKEVPEFSCNQLTYMPDGFGDVSSTGKFISVESHKNTSSGQIQNFRIPITVQKVVSPLSAIWDAVTIHGNTKMMMLNTDMDHSQWSIVYSCNIHGVRKYRWETIGIWSRQPFIDPIVRDTLKAYMVGLGFPIQSHKFHSQNNC